MRPSLLRRRGWRVTIQKSLLCFAALIGRFRRLLPSELAGWVLAGAHPALIWCMFNRRIPLPACRFRLFPSAIVAIPTPEVGRRVTSVSGTGPTIRRRHAVGNTKYGTDLHSRTQHVVSTRLYGPLDQRSSGPDFRRSYGACTGAFNVHWRAQGAPNAARVPVPDRPSRNRGSRIGPNTDSDDRIGSKRLKENR